MLLITFKALHNMASGYLFELISVESTLRASFSLKFIRSSHIQFLFKYIYIYIYSVSIHKYSYIDHLSMWLGTCNSSVDRALHQYRKVMGSNPIQA